MREDRRLAASQLVRQVRYGLLNPKIFEGVIRFCSLLEETAREEVEHALTRLQEKKIGKRGIPSHRGLALDLLAR